MLVGERVRLRLLERGDLESIAQWRREPRVAANFFGAWPFASSEQERWYEGYLADPTQRMWIVETAQGGPIGCMALTSIDYHNQSAELGRVLIGDQNHIMADCAKEAVGILVRFAFQDVNLNRIEVRFFANNTAAGDLYRACGFLPEGVLRQAIWKAGEHQDVMLMSILRGESE